jgi:hypothetical protein
VAIDDDVRELRTDVKSLLVQTATLSQKLDEHVRPCQDLKAHLENHEKGRGALVWCLQYIILPTAAAIAAYAAAIFGIGKTNP